MIDIDARLKFHISLENSYTPYYFGYNRQYMKKEDILDFFWVRDKEGDFNMSANEYFSEKNIFNRKIEWVLQILNN